MNTKPHPALISASIASYPIAPIGCYAVLLSIWHPDRGMMNDCGLSIRRAAESVLKSVQGCDKVRTKKAINTSVCYEHELINGKEWRKISSKDNLEIIIICEFYYNSKTVDFFYDSEEGFTDALMEVCAQHGLPLDEYTHSER